MGVSIYMYIPITYNMGIWKYNLCERIYIYMYVYKQYIHM